MAKKRSKKDPPKSSRSNLSKVLLITGILLISASILWSVYQKTVLSFDGIPEKSITDIIDVRVSKPVEIIIPTQSIDLNIKESVITRGVWEINPEGASHLNTSANPGEKGNIIIYGHNKINLLGKIRNLHKGDVFSIKNSEGTTRNYFISKILIVEPKDVWILDDTDEETLTLYTCTGLFDSKRFVVIAKPIQ